MMYHLKKMQHDMWVHSVKPSGHSSILDVVTVSKVGKCTCQPCLILILIVLSFRACAYSCLSVSGMEEIYRSFSCWIHFLIRGLHVSDAWFTRLCGHASALLSIPLILEPT
jgi:hypothetical protein